MKNPSTPLSENEQVLHYTFGTWLLAATSPVSADIYLTNKRIIAETNSWAQAIAKNNPVWFATQKYGELDTVSISHDSITQVVPGKYRLFGFIPTRDIAIELHIGDEKTAFLCEQRNEWIESMRRLGLSIGS